MTAVVFVAGWITGAATILALLAIRRPLLRATALPPATARQIRCAARTRRMELPQLLRTR
jgi:hypothetical protein